jgi:hypothetical protein
MFDKRRFGVALLVCAGSFGLACGARRGGKDARSGDDPASKRSGAASANSAVDAPATPLAAFASRAELVAWLREENLVRPAPSPNAPNACVFGQGNTWGDGVGDSFGAGGLGLSGTGEGGGGKGEGIGLGAIGTIGHGAGTGRAGTTSVTNTQHAGVDEGGIVKVRGEHLVVLRRGRLFTVRLGDLTPISAVDAFAPGISPDGDWYDEMLVANDTIVVIGYSHARGGTEIGLFDLDVAGRITARATYHMRANDYYSSRNYASRLVGDQLILYTPHYVNADERDPLAWLPAVRRWRTGAKASDFDTIIEPTSIITFDRWHPADGALALHTVTTCDLGKRTAPGGMTCTARGVLGPAGRTFYVSPEAVYVWVTPWRSFDDAERPSLLYRLPLDPTARMGVLRTRGRPIDQLSFLERDGYLNVALRADGTNGDAMWAPETTAGAGALSMLRIPLASFASRAETVPDSSYVALPALPGGVLHNRFVGDFLLLGTGQGWGRPASPARPRVVLHRYAGGATPMALPLTHGVDRIEPLGTDAIVVGTDGANLTFSSIALDAPGRSPFVADQYTRRNVAQGELRSHGFFYRNDGDRSGVVGLPIRRSGSRGSDYLTGGSASILYLHNDGLHLRELGALDAKASAVGVNDHCRASCVDWYGNARPLFVESRIMALLGYELVEGRMDAGTLQVDKRMSFAPR